MNSDRMIGLALFGAGLLAGVMLVSMLPGMPWSAYRATQDATIADLEAQRSMAAAAWYMVLLSVLAFGVGVVSIVLLRQNLIEARNVTKEANRSAKAAEETLDATRKIAAEERDVSRRQARAYVFVSASMMRRDMDNTHSPTIRFRNAGQTPARNIQMIITLRALDLAGNTHVIGTSTTNVATMGAGEADEISPLYPAAGKERYMVLGKETFIVKLALSFKDVFGMRHDEEVTWRAEYPTIATPSARMVWHQSVHD